MHPTTSSGPKRLWQRASLTQRLTFVALAPTLATAALLVTLLTRHQLTALREMAQGNAETIAAQTASVSVQPLRDRQLRELARIAESIGRLPHVARVQIRTAAGQILAEHLAPRPPQTDLMSVTRDVVEQNQAGPTVLGSVLVDISLRDAIDAQQASLRHALLALLLSLLIAAVIGWQAARWISAPLRRLVLAVQQLGHGDNPVAVAVTDHTEIGELQQGFNHAALALFNARRGLEQKIEKATEELALKNAALEAASVTRSRFLAAASNDLRQPLHALTLFSSALAVEEADPLQLDRIAHIQECVESLDQLFGELLDLSRLDTGAVQVDISAFPLNHVFADVSRNFAMVAEHRGLRLTARKSNLWVRTDRMMLTRMLNNLVGNALRFTRRGGALIGARRAGPGRVRIEVWDTGSGIAPEHLPSVFDEFYRIDDHVDAGLEDGSHSGLGLGLATVQRLGEMINTPVGVESRLGRGSKFHFQLSRTEPCAEMTTTTPEAPVDLTGKRVLVLDDDPAILAGVHFLLHSWHCDVMVAEDKLQALAAVESWPGPPDIVITDLQLRTGESGLQVLAALDDFYRRDDEPPFARLIITGETRIDHLRQVMEAKIPLLYKPVSPAQLQKAMLAACQAAHGTAGPNEFDR